MKRVILIITAICVLLAFTACSAQPASDIDVIGTGKAMVDADENIPAMKSVSSESDDAAGLFASLSDMDYGKVASYYLAYAADGTAYEIAIVALKDTADVKECEKSLQAHIESRIKLYKAYTPEEVPRAEKAEIVTRDNCVALIMSDNNPAVKAVFKN